MTNKKRSTIRVVHPVRNRDEFPSRVQQQHKKECDMNTIVARAQKGISPAYVNKNVAYYMDTTGVPDLAQAFDAIQAANEAFMSLPAALRRELGNDPRNLQHLDEDQIRRHGLAKSPLESSLEGDQGSGGGRPPEKEPKAPKEPKSSSLSKGSKTAPSEQDSQD